MLSFTPNASYLGLPLSRVSGPPRSCPRSAIAPICWLGTYFRRFDSACTAVIIPFQSALHRGGPSVALQQSAITVQAFGRYRWVFQFF